jgi:hypothetical protein
MDDAGSDIKHLLLMPLKRGFFMASIEGICMIKSELVRAITHLAKIDASDDKALVTGLYGAFGLPVPDDLAAKYNLEPTESSTGVV